MDEERIKKIVSDVVHELDLGERRFEVDTSMSGADARDIQIRLVEGDGDTKSVAVSLSGSDGQDLSEEDIRQRVRQQLVTFAAIDVAS
jgi:hypothetical protein